MTAAVLHRARQFLFLCYKTTSFCEYALNQQQNPDVRKQRKEREESEGASEDTSARGGCPQRPFDPGKVPEGGDGERGCEPRRSPSGVDFSERHFGQISRRRQLDA